MHVKMHMKFMFRRPLGLTLPAFAMIAALSANAFEMDRTHLPIAEPDPPKFKELDVRNVEAPPLFSVTAPEGAPNVVIVLIDDVGQGVLHTPNVRRTLAMIDWRFAPLGFLVGAACIATLSVVSQFTL